jgi:DNA-binding transcriptional MocR family regulator
MRIGWAVAAHPLIQKLTLAKQGVDLHTSSLSQRLLAVYLRDADAEERITHICDTYRHRRNVMVRSLEAEMPREVAFTRPEGGLFLWATLPRHVNARELLPQSLEQQVAFVPGGSFFPNGGHENTMRLNFSNMPPERIVEGVTRLAAVVRHELERATSSPGGSPKGLYGEQPSQATVYRQAGCAKGASAHE